MNRFARWAILLITSLFSSSLFGGPTADEKAAKDFFISVEMKCYRLELESLFAMVRSSDSPGNPLYRDEQGEQMVRSYWEVQQELLRSDWTSQAGKLRPQVIQLQAIQRSLRLHIEAIEAKAMEVMLADYQTILKETSFLRDQEYTDRLESAKRSYAAFLGAFLEGKSSIASEDYQKLFQSANRHLLSIRAAAVTHKEIQQLIILEQVPLEKDVDKSDALKVLSTLVGAGSFIAGGLTSLSAVFSKGDATNTALMAAGAFASAIAAATYSRWMEVHEEASAVLQKDGREAIADEMMKRRAAAAAISVQIANETPMRVPSDTSELTRTVAEAFARILRNDDLDHGFCGTKGIMGKILASFAR